MLIRKMELEDITSDALSEMIDKIVDAKLEQTKNYIFTSTAKYRALVIRLKKILNKALKYIIETRRINKVCIADDVIYKKEILNEINENFPEFNIEEFEYKQDEIAMKKEIDKFKKSKKIHNRVIRKIKRIFKKN